MTRGSTQFERRLSRDRFDVGGTANTVSAEDSFGRTHLTLADECIWATVDGKSEFRSHQLLGGKETWTTSGVTLMGLMPGGVETSMRLLNSWAELIPPKSTMTWISFS